MTGTISTTLTAPYGLQTQVTTVTNTGGVTVASGTAITGVFVDASTTWTLINAGHIKSGGGTGVYLRGHYDEVTNQVGGLIDGTQYGVITVGPNQTVVNAGTIGTSALKTGVDMTGGGAVTNTGTGALISGGEQGVYLGRAPGVISTVVNDTGATITSSKFGVHGYGPVDLTNAGRISGAVVGVYLNDGGSVTNLSSGLITSSSGIALHLYSSEPGTTVTNFGTIAGAIGKDAVLFGESNNRLVDEASAVFTGKVDGGYDRYLYAGDTSTLELASGASTGTLNGLGTNFVNFNRIDVDSNAVWELSGNNYVPLNTSITNAGTLILSNAVLVDGGVPGGGGGYSYLVNNGVVLLDPSTLSTGGLTGTGSVTIGAGSYLQVNATVASGQTIDFGGDNGVLNIVNAPRFAGTIAGLNNTDTISLSGLAYGYDGATGSVTNNKLTISTGGVSVTLAVSGVADGTPVTVQANPYYSGTFVMLCFLAGTRIATLAGQVPVQSLQVGDEVITASGGVRPIRWIGTGRVLATPGRRSAATPVIVYKGAIADNVPNRDLYVTKGHSLFIDDVLIPVEFLVNHRSIVWGDHAREVELFHIDLDTHDVLLANGAMAESYRDDGNRWLFRDGNDSWDHEPQAPCAPVLTGGPIVDAIWARLLDRAGPRPGLPMTDDADVHLMVDGQRVDGIEHPDGVVTFSLPSVPSCARIVSRAVVPQELGLARDARMLGVALSRITVSQGRAVRTIEADNAVFGTGFHLFEAADVFRWTNGDAAIPPALFAGLEGPCRLELAIACSTRYPATEPDDAKLAA